MDLSYSLEAEFHRLISLNDGISREEKERIISEGETTLDIAENLVFQFDKNPVLEAELIGSIDFEVQDKKIPSWKFKDGTGREWIVPKYQELQKQIKEEEPGKHIYRIMFEGIQETDPENFFYKFVVFRKYKEWQQTGEQ